MRIKKIYQTSQLAAQVVNTDSNSINNTFSCNYIKTLLQPNYIVVGLKNNWTVNTNDTPIPFDKVQETVGDKLTLSSNKIVIGANVHHVRVSSAVFYENVICDYIWSAVTKNTTDIIRPIFNDTGYYISCQFPALCISAQENDTIWIKNNISNRTSAIIRASLASTFLCVEVID